MNLDMLATELHRTSVEKGFWEPLKRMDKQDSFIFYAKQIAMIQSEATEVLEALRKSKDQREVVDELADIIIRTLDLWAGLDEAGVTTTSLYTALLMKADTNKNRPKLHGVKG